MHTCITCLTCPRYDIVCNIILAKNQNKKTKTEYVTGSRVTQLFNVTKDPWETTDLSFLPEYNDLLKTMRSEMKNKAIELGDKKESVEERFDFWDYYSLN